MEVISELPRCNEIYAYQKRMNAIRSGSSLLTVSDVGGPEASYEWHGPETFSFAQVRRTDEKANNT